MKMATGTIFIGNFVHLFFVLCFILFLFFSCRYWLKETMRSAIGWAITSFLICILIILEFYIGTWPFFPSAILFATYFVNFLLALCSSTGKIIKQNLE